jgi:wyosine [tRNA(Phe)-imidazoG37] synthetase (radical SAM superfamily)
MSTILFDRLVFGPVYSRRLGISLGINLLPVDSKYCNFNCIYCECGWTKNGGKNKLVLPKRTDLKQLLSEKLQELRGTIHEPDAITFAGNGEPTIHPDFAAIIDDTLAVRDKFSPHTRISVLSNASMLHKQAIRKALEKVDQNILKLDTGIQSTFELLNQSQGNLTVAKLVKQLVAFEGKLIIQTLFVRGTYNGHYIDNTTSEEIAAWLPLVKRINPEYVMIYPIDRGTPVKELEKIPAKELESIADKVNGEGIKTEVYY